MSFISKNPIEVSRLYLKVMDKFQRGCLKMFQKMVLPTPLWNLSITFRWSFKTWNGFLEIKLNLVFQLFLVWIFLKKDILLYLTRSEICFLTQFLHFHLTLSGFTFCEQNWKVLNMVQSYLWRIFYLSKWFLFFSLSSPYKFLSNMYNILVGTLIFSIVKVHNLFICCLNNVF